MRVCFYLKRTLKIEDIYSICKTLIFYNLYSCYFVMVDEQVYLWCVCIHINACLTTFMRSFISCLSTPTTAFYRRMLVRVFYIFDRFDKKTLVGQRVRSKKNGMLFVCIKQQHTNDIFCCVASLEVNSRNKSTPVFC